MTHCPWPNPSLDSRPHPRLPSGCLIPSLPVPSLVRPLSNQLHGPCWPCWKHGHHCSRFSLVLHPVQSACSFTKKYLLEHPQCTRQFPRCQRHISEQNEQNLCPCGCDILPGRWKKHTRANTGVRWQKELWGEKRSGRKLPNSPHPCLPLSPHPGPTHPFSPTLCQSLGSRPQPSACLLASGLTTSSPCGSHPRSQSDYFKMTILSGFSSTQSGFHLPASLSHHFFPPHLSSYPSFPSSGSVSRPNPPKEDLG